jgi:hypothetical protein
LPAAPDRRNVPGRFHGLDVSTLDMEEVEVVA